MNAIAAMLGVLCFGLCHPDKHGNSPAANEMTAKLLSLRRSPNGPH
jgi:hypothetical protein